MKLNDLKAVVFDCDGVMFDTAAANRRYYNRVLEQFGKPALTEAQFVKVHMYTVQEALAFLFPEDGMRDAVTAYTRQVGYHSFIPDMKQERGLKTLLADLRRNNLYRAVATNRTNTMAAVLTIHKLSACFDMVVTAADVVNPKPAPDQLHKIMDRFAVRASQMLFIGDSVYDQMAAEQAGTPFAAFRNHDLTADFHVRCMADINGIVGINQ